MRQLVCTSLCWLAAVLMFGQKDRTSEIMAIPEIKTDHYEPLGVGEESLRLKMGFASAYIIDSATLRKLSGAMITGVDIVFSDYPKDNPLTELNRNRVQNLTRTWPVLLSDRRIRWQFIRQTGCTDKISAARLFHGAVIHYRPRQDEETAKREVGLLKELLSGLGSKAETGYFTSYALTVDSVGSPSVVFSDSGYFMPFPIPDSTVTRVLNRNKWRNMVITADLTGSMYPYTAQLLLWFKLHCTDGRVKRFVFFNDGNLLPDHLKVIGKTGGIYDGLASTYEEVEKLAYKTMSNGSGGDGPENDVEALLKAIRLSPDCEEVILIADNWAPVKDISLISGVTKPVHVILCGAGWGINTQYLDLARITGGSVHTMEQDLTELMKLKEGAEITISGQTFRIMSGKFVRVSRL